MWGRDLRGNNATCSALSWFSVTSLLPASKLGPSGADSQVSGFVYVLGPFGSLQWTLLWGLEFLPLLQPQRVFQSEVLRLYFPALETWVAWSVSLSSCSFLFIHMQMWDCPVCQLQLPTPVLQLLPCHESSLPWLPVSAPPTSLDECFFFTSLVVRLPYSSIFWQFLLFFCF